MSLQRPLQDRISECRQLIIQNMQKAILHKMVYMYLKERKKDTDVKNFSVNTKDGIIKMEFSDHAKALEFYNENNFKDRILLRYFNIYFNLSLTQNEMKKYFFEGLTEQNQRLLFQEARKYAICKIYTSYGTNAVSNVKGKVKPTGILSLIRKNPLSQIQLKELTANLAKLGIKLSPYQHEKGLKLSLNLLNFIGNQHVKQDQSKLSEIAGQNAKKILQKYGLDEPSHSSFLVKKKQATETRPQVTVFSSAFLQFDSVEKTIKNFQKLRIAIIKEPKVTAKLFFHNEQANSYYSLFTKNLKKQQKQITDKQFQNILLQDCRKINKNVLQFLVYPDRADTFVGRIYFNSEEEGRSFVATYQNYRYILVPHFNQKQVVFNINIDQKTLRRIKIAEKRAKDNEGQIKKYSQIVKKQKNATKPNNQIPINSNFLPPNIGIGINNPAMIIPHGQGIPSQGIPNQGIAMMYPQKGMINTSGMPMPPVAVGLNMMQPPMNYPPKPSRQMQFTMILKDKKRFLEIDPKQAKKTLHPHVIFIIEENRLALDSKQASNLATEIISGLSISEIFEFLENPKTLPVIKKNQ